MAGVADDLVQLLRASAQAGMDAMAEFLSDEVRAEAPGAELKGNIGWFAEELARIIGPVNEPLAPWWRIAELGGVIRAKNWFPYIHSARQTLGPFLWIPLQKGPQPFVPTIKLFRRGADSGAAIEYDPTSKRLGGVIAALKSEVYHPPHKGTGYLNVVIQEKLGEAIQRFEQAMQEVIDQG